MRTLRPILLALVAIYLLAASFALGQGGNVEEQIKALQAQLVQALLKGDTSFFEKYYADDVTIIHGDGKLSTKADDEEIKNLKSGATKYESIDVPESKVRVYGDTAVVNSLISGKGMVNGKPYS